MKSDSNIFFLHYILYFIDNQFKVCNSIDETFCKESILGQNIDQFYQIQNESYEFICTEYNTLAKSFHNNHGQRPWMAEYIENYVHEIYNSTHQSLEKFIITKNIGLYVQKIFYVQEIQLKMERKLFEKIVLNSNFSRKEYTSKELFFLCYSYAFSIFDNYSIILKNILYLISRRMFDLNEISQEFFHYSSKIHIDSDFLILFQNEYINKKHTCDLTSAIYKFIAVHDNIQSQDDFLNDIRYWKFVLTNIFVSIRQTVCFCVSINDKKFFVEIQYSKHPKFILNISDKHIDDVIALVSNESRFFLNSFTDQIKLIFLAFINAKTEIQIKLNITSFYQKLYKYNEWQIGEENRQFHNFISFLFENSENQIEIYIATFQIVFEKGKNGSYEITKKTLNHSSNIDESLLISKKILMLNMNIIGNPIKKIAELIYTDFMASEFQQIQDNSISGNEQILQLSSIANSFMAEFSIDKNSNFQNSQQNSQSNHNSISLMGNDQHKWELIGIKGLNQRLIDFNFLGGIIDYELSLFELNTITENNQIKNECNFVSNMCRYFQIKFGKNNEEFKKDCLPKACVFYNSEFNSNGYLSFNPTSIIDQQKSNNIKNVRLSSTNFNELYETRCFYIHHDISKYSFKNEYELTDYYCNPNLSIYKNDAHCYHFEITNSNYHLLIYRLIELRSIEQTLSTVKKHIHSFYTYYLECRYSYVKFINDDFNIIHDFYFFDCMFKTSFCLNFVLKNQKQHHIKIINSSYVFPIYISKYLKMKSIDYQNSLILKTNIISHSLEITKFKVDFCGRIPEYLMNLKLSDCQLNAQNNILILDHKFFHNDTDKDLNLSSINKEIIHEMMNNKFLAIIEIINSIFPDNFKIMGIFCIIEIEDCSSSSLQIDSYFRLIKIGNFNGKFSISGLADNVSSKVGINRFVKHEFYMKIQNLKIDYIRNVKAEIIELIDCDIFEINNLRCKKLYIVNTSCSFYLKRANQIYHFSFELMNLQINDEKFMILDGYD